MKLLLILVYILPVAVLLGQIDPITAVESKTISLKIGLSHTSINDKRIGNTSFNAWSPKYEVTYSKIKANSRRHIQFQFTSVSPDKHSLLTMSSIRPNVNFSYERKVKDGIWVGGFSEHHTLLNFPSAPKNIFVNNPISYNILQFIGPRLTYTKQEVIKGKRIDLTTSAQTALLGYVIQPAFGHPYPEEYLDEDVFSPTQEGMTWPLLKSGKFLTLNKFRALKIEIGFHYYINESWKIGIDYQSDLLYTNATGKALHLIGNDLMIGASYIH